ncbi:unnamed protein product, partial [Allacma fusca]
MSSSSADKIDEHAA